MPIQPTSLAFTLLLGFLAAVPFSGVDIKFACARGDRRHAWHERLGKSA
jgi:hypothetical protein